MLDKPPAPTAPAVPGSSPVDVVKFFRALADPTRLKLLEYILLGERTTAECVEHVGISQPRVSVHLSCLADCGYVTARRHGHKLRYSAGDPRVAELIVLARSLAADNAGSLGACPRIPPAVRT